MTDKEAIIKKRLERKAKGLTKKAMITPYPISNGVSGDNVQGIILQYMFPCEGKITKGAIDLGKKPKGNISLVISFGSEESLGTKSFLLTKQKFVVDLDFNVKVFDKLTASILNVTEKPEDNLVEVYAAFLWIPTIKDIEVKSFLISELEKEDA